MKHIAKDVFASSVQVNCHRNGEVSKADVLLSGIGFDPFPAEGVSLRIHLKAKLDEIDLNHRHYRVTITPIDPPVEEES